MLELFVLSVILASLFGLGYYLGNQFGRSAHIRENLQRARDANVIVRIQNQLLTGDFPYRYLSVRSSTDAHCAVIAALFKYLDQFVDTSPMAVVAR